MKFTYKQLKQKLADDFGIELERIEPAEPDARLAGLLDTWVFDENRELSEFIDVTDLDETRYDLSRWRTAQDKIPVPSDVRRYLDDGSLEPADFRPDGVAHDVLTEHAFSEYDWSPWE